MRLLLLFCSLIFLKAAAQPAPANVAPDSVQALVREFYNANQSDRVYALTNENFQRQIPTETFREFITGTFANMDAWQSSTQPRLVGNVWHYKAVFRNATMDFLIQLDGQRKISLFALQPTQAPVRRKATVLTTNSLRSLLDRQVDAAVQDYVTNDRVVGLSIGILRNDSLFTFGYGETAKGSGHSPDGSTLFEIGSVTKTFTAALLADAIRRGVVRLEDPVSQYLPDSLPRLRHNGIDVTLKMLANHTSGLPRMATNWNAGSAFALADPYAVYDEQALFAYLKTPTFAHKPGTIYEYSNLATGLLGTVLTRLAGKSYEQLLTEVICGPLQLNDTRLTLTASDESRRAQGYDETGLMTSAWTFRALAGAGAIRSTATDLLRYLRANVGTGPAALVDALRATHEQTFADENPVETVGLGWHIVNRTGWWWHNGGTGGFRSFVGFNPVHKTAFVLLTNSAAQPLDGLDWKLIKAAGL